MLPSAYLRRTLPDRLIVRVVVIAARKTNKWAVCADLDRVKLNKDSIYNHFAPNASCCLHLGMIAMKQ